MRRILASVLLAAALHAAWADQVVPIDRVETRLRVREGPTSGSPVVGHLHPGESARHEAEETVSYWYRVTLGDGTPGYVSKAWSRLVPDQAGGARYLRVGGWNMKKLGHGTSKDVARLAQVVESHFDVVAVIEAMQKGGGHPGYDALLAQLGDGWDGMVTDDPRPNTTSGNAEFYAVVYRVAAARPCDGWTGLQYLADNDGSGSGAGPDVFTREPAFGCFAARLPDGSTGFDFMLAAYHARWDGHNVPAIRAEVGHVAEVFDAMAQAEAGEADRILVGDFNLVTSALEDVLERAVEIVGTASTLNSRGALSANLYDHMVIHDRAATAELAGAPEILDVRDVASDARTFYRTVSDHLPVRARFRADLDDD
jgi:endonuclease/exonuclease/phosphatase family metal-dependent hydrolase